MNETNFIEVMPSEMKPIDNRMEKMELKFLPPIPSTFLILGQCGSGKSSFLWSVMTRGYVYTGKSGKVKSLFDELLIYLGTLDSLASFEKMPVNNKLILTEFDPVVFNEYQDDLKKHQLELLEKGKPMLNTCIIMDDFAGTNLMKKAKSNAAPPIEKLCLTSRHESNTTIFYCSQMYRNTGFTSPAVRANLTTIVLYRMPVNEIRKIAEEYSEQYEVDEFIAIYDKVMSKPYAFCVYDRRRDATKDRWTIGFTTSFPPSKKSLQFKNLETKR
jgi:hypothetical protein